MKRTPIETSPLLRLLFVIAFLTALFAIDGAREPVRVVSAAGFYKSIANGGGHSCALTPEGVVRCWGSNNAGQLGNGSTTGSSPSVAVLSLTSGVQKVVTGATHSCALTAANGVKCWGRNNEGQVGNASNTNALAPADVSGLTSGVLDIDAGGHESCAVLQDGTVKCWGWNSLGQLGSGGGNSNVPLSVSGITTALKVTVGGMFDGGHACALLAGGGMQCWGDNSGGQLGNNSRPNGGSTPVDVVDTDNKGLLDDVISIDAGRSHTCAITVQRALLCWGKNVLNGGGAGVIGDGTSVFSRDLPTPVTDMGSGVKTVSAGDSKTCAVLNVGAVKCWGDEYTGDGTDQSRLVPTPVDGMDIGYTGVAVGWAQTCGLSSSGTIKCWGDAGDGLGQCSSSNDAKPSPASICGQGASVFGIVTGPSAQRLNRAIVEVCPDTPAPGDVCRTGSTDVAGNFSLTGLGGGAHTIRVRSTGSHPPFSAPITLTENVSTQRNVTMRNPMPAPDGAIDNEEETPDEVPIIRVHEEFTLSMNEEPLGTATYRIRKAGVDILTGDIPEISPGVYRKTLVSTPPQLYGPIEIYMKFVGQGPPPPESGFDVYVDPSGFVKTVQGDPIVGATVSLYRSESADGPFDVVPDGNVIMSPSNRANPDTTDATGHFGWDVISGYYFVRATAPGCKDPNAKRNYVDTQVYTIPPPVFDIDLRLSCPPPNTDTDGDGYIDANDPKPNSFCDIMRADINATASVDIFDLATVAGAFGQNVGGNVLARWDQGPPNQPTLRDGSINIFDLSAVAGLFGKNISACP